MPTPACPARVLALTLLAACSGDAGTGVQPAKSSRTRAVNVVLIVIDTLRADATRDPEATPCLARLARDGVDFPRAFSSAPMTLPSHMSLFSSRPPSETKVLNNQEEVPHELPLLAGWLLEQGYDTRAVISLATLKGPGPDPKQGPGRGFLSYEHGPWVLANADETATILSRSLRARDERKPLFLFAHFSDPHEPYDAHGTESNQVALRVNESPVTELLSSEMRPWTGPIELGPGRSTFELLPTKEEQRRFRVRQFDCLEKGVLLDVQWEEGALMEGLRRATLVVDRHERPAATCRLYVWLSDTPGNERMRRQHYALEVAFVDRYVGELLAELERLGLYEESLILLTSDHGEALGEKGVVGHVENLRDEMLHVPLIIKLPAGDPRRPELEQAATRVVTHLDLVPTLLELVGLPPLPGQRGRSLLDPHDAVHVAETHRPEALRTQIALRDARFKMVFFPDEDRFELYDLERDPGESLDTFATLAQERPDWPERLRQIHLRSVQARGNDRPDDPERDAMLRALGYAGDE